MQNAHKAQMDQTILMDNCFVAQPWAVIFSHWSAGKYGIDLKRKLLFQTKF